MRGFRRLRVTKPSFGIPRGVKWFAVLLGGVYLSLRLADLMLLGPLSAVAQTEARLWGIDAINRVALGTVGRSLGHEDLVTYVKDGEGRITAYSIRTQMVNQVAAEVATAVQREFRRTGESAFQLPLGAASGTRLLATTGPTVPVSVIPIGSVSVDVHQSFEGAGINQTRHRIWLRATAVVQVVLPIVTREVQVTSDLPITETVIVGPVPSSFYSGKVDGVSVPARRKILP